MVTFRLARCSHTAEVRVDEQFAYTHLHQDLVLVLDGVQGVGSGSSSPVLKVLQGTQILEEIPLENLIHRSNRLFARAQQHRIGINDDQLPISAIVRCPLLAIRWNSSTEHQRPVRVRRIQVKFTSAAEFDVAFNHLHALGLRMRLRPEEQPPQQQEEQQPTPRPSTSDASLPSSNRSRSTTTRETSPSMPPPPLAENSRRPSSAASSQLPSLHQSMSNPSYEANTVRPTSAYSALVARQRNSQYSADLARPNPLIPPEVFPRPDSSPSNLGLRSNSNTGPFQDYSSVYSSFEADAANSTIRPSSATPYLGSDSLLPIPPRRELPVGRPSSAKIVSRVSPPPRTPTSSGLMGPPPQPSPNRRGSRSSSATLVSNDPLSMSPLPQPTLIDGTERYSPVLSSPSMLPRRGSDLKRPTTIIGDGYRSEAATRGSSMSPRPLSALSETGQNSRMQPRGHLGTPPASETIDRVASELSKSAAAHDLDTLAAYAMQSAEGRMAALNDFMMQHIDDANFQALVEDVSTCWAKIGLGLEDDVVEEKFRW